MTLEDIKKVLGTENLVIGKDKTLKGLKKGELGKVFLSSNCPSALVEDVKKYGADVKVLKKTNEELGVVCKKPFSISVLSIKK